MQDLVSAPSDGLLGLSYPGVNFSPEGLTLPANLPFSEWVAIGTTLKQLHAALPWALGAWLEHGKAHFSDRYSQALEATDYNGRQSLYNISRVYREFANVDSRYEGLSFSHHQELANIPAEYRPALAERAIEEGLSTYQLREEIAHEKAVLGMVEPPYEVETADEYLQRWISTMPYQYTSCGGLQYTLETLCNPTVEGSGRVLDIILSRRKAALARGKKD